MIESEIRAYFVDDQGISIIPESDWTQLVHYLEIKRENSDNTYRNKKSHLKHFYMINNKPIELIEIQDVEKYVKHLKQRYTNRTTQRNHLQSVKAYYNQILKWLGARGIVKPNVFQYMDIDIMKKEKPKNVVDMKVSINMHQTKAMAPHLMNKIIHAAEMRSKKEFVFFLILKYTGMRISECISIRIENIDVEERVIATGVIRNMRKGGLVYYFVPKHVMLEIEDYMLGLESGEEWLFPSHKSEICYKNPQELIRRFKRETGINGWTSHQFRHTIIYKRLKMGCPGSISDVLMNHALKGTQAIFYRENNLTLADRRDFYDKWNPYDN